MPARGWQSAVCQKVCHGQEGRVIGGFGLGREMRIKFGELCAGSQQKQKKDQGAAHMQALPQGWGAMQALLGFRKRLG